MTTADLEEGLQSNSLLVLLGMTTKPPPQLAAGDVSRDNNIEVQVESQITRKKNFLKERKKFIKLHISTNTHANFF